MAKGKLRTCLVDRTQYEYCPRCSNDPTWKFVFCCDSCRQVKLLMDRYENNHVSIKEANEILDSLDLSNLENFDEYYKSKISEIRANSTTKKSAKSKKEESKEETPLEEPSGDSE